MNFQTISPVEDSDFILDLAFRRAREKGKKLRGLKLKGGRLEKSRYIELMKMQVISDTIAAKAKSTVERFPSLDGLPEFYNEMIRLEIDYRQFKKSLAAVHWLEKGIMQLFSTYRVKLKTNKQFDRIAVLKREFLGRASSVIKQVKKDFVFLENARYIMKGFPTIKTGLKTISLVGFPNVGKTTLLYKLTGSKADINSYPFTTKGINVAYAGTGKSRIQLLDTPGTLNRFYKMNRIEKVAHLALKHCTDIAVYVFDLTEEYPLEKQVQLYENLLKTFSGDVHVYFSKRDVADPVLMKEYMAKYKDSMNTISSLKQIINSLKEKEIPEESS